MNILKEFPPDSKRPFQSLRLDIGAYQFLKLIASDLGDNYTDGGKAPLTLLGQLTTPMDEAFINKTVSVLLTEKAQQDIIEILDYNLHNNIDGIDSVIKRSQYSMIEK
jgi:hypothetical protein